jgi:(hydroxyamino)benzene mutase
MSVSRHPLDPDPVRAGKASAVLGLGVVAVVTGPLLGGIIPAVLALVMARESRRDLIAAQGFLIGVKRIRIGVRLAWAGIVLALAMVVVGVIAALLHYAAAPSVHFGPTVN